ncbi:MAG: TIR domain-containing protein [Anaerolineae bacterium]
MEKTTCRGITKSGHHCRIMAGESGYCHIHDPDAIKTRQAIIDEQTANEKKNWEKGTRIRELIEVVQKACIHRGWHTYIQYLDQDTWKYATIEVNREVNLKNVSAIIEVSCDQGNYRITYQATTYDSYGLKGLWDTIKSDLDTIPWFIAAKNTTSDIEKKRPDMLQNKKVFVVHGHDKEAELYVESFLKQVNLEPVILHQQANKGMTIFEKLEANSDVAFAIIILSPDDLGHAVDEAEEQFRARQNVILELGIFIGKFGRNRVCPLIKGELERPSDIDGLVYVTMDNNEGWKIKLGRELKEAGLSGSYDKIM